MNELDLFEVEGAALIDLGPATEMTLGITDAVQKEDHIYPHGRDF